MPSGETCCSGESMYGDLVITYLFLGGAAGGSYFVIALWSLLFHRKSPSLGHRMCSAFKALLSRAYGITLVVLTGALLCLIWDLGSPERALLLLTRPHPTFLTFGAFLLSALYLAGALLAIANVFDVASISGRVRKTLEVAIVPLSLGTMLYTGAFLASNASVPFWNTWWLIALFFLSSLSSGVSVVLLIDYFTQGSTVLLQAAKPLQRMHIACLLCEALCLAGFLHAGLSNPAAIKSAELLLQPDMLSIAFVGVVLLGIVLPLFLESYSLARKQSRSIPFSDAVCLIGSFCLRYCIIMCGTHWIG